MHQIDWKKCHWSVKYEQPNDLRLYFPHVFFSVFCLRWKFRLKSLRSNWRTTSIGYPEPQTTNHTPFGRRFLWFSPPPYKKILPHSLASPLHQRKYPCREKRGGCFAGDNPPKYHTHWPPPRGRQEKDPGREDSSVLFLGEINAGAPCSFTPLQDTIVANSLVCAE